MDFPSILTAVASFLVSLGGGAAICLALSSWVGRLWADRLMAKEMESFRKNTERELELLRSEQRKTFHIHSLQFEAEFNAVRTIWVKLSRASVATMALRPVFEMVDKNESKDDRKTRKAKNFIECYRELETIFTSERPFISTELEKEIASIIEQMRDEFIEFEELDDGKVMRFKEAKERMKQISHAVDRLSELIRIRIGLITKISAPPNIFPDD